MPRWLVFRLSICLRKSSVQRSLQRNFIVSRGVVGRGLSREKLWCGWRRLAWMVAGFVCLGMLGGGWGDVWEGTMGILGFYVCHTVLQLQALLYSPALPVCGTRLPVLLPRRLCLPLRRRPHSRLLCCPHRCLLLLTSGALWMRRMGRGEMLLRVRRGRWLCGMPWERAR